MKRVIFILMLSVLSGSVLAMQKEKEIKSEITVQDSESMRSLLESLTKLDRLSEFGAFRHDLKNESLYERCLVAAIKHLACLDMVKVKEIEVSKPKIFEEFKKFINKPLDAVTGNTFLHYAQTPEQVEVLLYLGADGNVLNTLLQTPVFVMLLMGQTKAAEYLFNKMGNNLPTYDDFSGSCRIVHLAARGGALQMLHHVHVSQDAAGQDPLVYASIGGKDGLSSVKSILPNCNAEGVESGSHRTPLMNAIRAGHAGAFQVLLAHRRVLDGLNYIDKQGFTALMHAIDVDNWEFVGALIEAGAAIDCKVLCIACRKLSVDKVAKIIERFNISQRSAEQVKAFFQGEFQGRRPIMEAAFAGNLDVVKLLIENYKVPVNAWKTNCEHVLISAVAGNAPDIVTYLIKDKKYQVDLACEKGSHETALIRAITTNNVPMVELLLQLGAKVTVADKSGVLPCAYAAIQGFWFQDKNGKIVVPILELLSTQPDCNLNAIDGESNTVLIHAATNGKTHAVRWLVDHKVDASTVNDQKQTALELALKNGHKNTAAVLFAEWQARV